MWTCKLINSRWNKGVESYKKLNYIILNLNKTNENLS